jgi:hypothetical protein
VLILTKCPNSTKHVPTCLDDDDKYVRYLCTSCHTYIYKPKERDHIENIRTELYDDYDILEFQKDIDDEEGFDLMCSEANRLFYR